MSKLTFIAEDTKSTVLLAVQTTATAAEAYVEVSAGSCALDLRAIATMGNAADLVLSLKYADDATGTNATAFGYNVPVYENGVRQDDAKAHTLSDATGDFIVDFCVDPALIPADKFVGISYANSNAANLLTTVAIEDCATKPSV